MIVLKFGGKSLASSQTFDKVLNVIKAKRKTRQIAVVVSAIGDTTDTLESVLDLALHNKDYKTKLETFKNRPYHQEIDLQNEFGILEKLYAGVNLLGDYNLKIKDQILAQGELISSKIIAHKLELEGLKTLAVDSRQLFISDNNFGNAQVLEAHSKSKTQEFFDLIPPETIAVVTGFIGATEAGETTTFGRNGSNYSASLLANFLDAEELQNYTHVDGIFTANPEYVKEATKIEELSFDDANELANFGASILHAKTILPLVKSNIPLRILNTLNPDNSGTLITAKPTKRGIKSLSSTTNVALIKLEGRGLLGTIGVDARIFSAMARENINVGVISQGSSERGIGFIVDQDDAQRALKALKKEFQHDFYTKDVDRISVQKDLSVLSIVGQELKDFDDAYSALVKNKIIPVLFNTTITGKNVSLVIKKEETQKALNVLHRQIFKVYKTINIFLFGCGTVGSALINQITAQKESLQKNQNLCLNIVAIANSKKILLNPEPINKDWKVKLEIEGQPYTIKTVLDYVEKQYPENCIAIDNTASEEFTRHYIPLIENGFDLISSNKIANSGPLIFYKKLQKTLNKHRKSYFYEANVGAGLPLIDTINLLHRSGEQILKIRGVFSGSLSYIFNRFATSELPFHKIIKEAQEKGYTEPDPREDLSGNDVGRKLLILAREIGLDLEFDQLKIQNLIPKNLQEMETPEFFRNLQTLDQPFKALKETLDKDQVLKYVGELIINTDHYVEVKAELFNVPLNSNIGRLQGSETLFEIYSENYKKQPILIQGHGAGAEVTARGVFGDILRISNSCR